MRLAISLLTSAGTLWGMWAAGGKKSYAWVIGLANQVVWLAFIVAFQSWGLLPLSAALVVVYSRNHLRWKREQAEAKSVAKTGLSFGGMPVVVSDHVPPGAVFLVNRDAVNDLFNKSFTFDPKRR